MSALQPQPDLPHDEFAGADFDRVRALLRARAGIALAPGKQAMVRSRLARRLREQGQPSVASYLRWLEQASGGEAEREWQAFVNCLTTNLTAFFREGHHFTLLAGELERRRGERLRLWSSAASTGEEAYSIAMTAVEALGPDAPLAIVASDIDTEVLATAERGVYPGDARGLSPERLRRHFLRGQGANAGRIRARPELRRLLAFRAHNLAADAPPPGAPFDYVFCRNVMIYFDAATQRRVLERIHAALRPRGLLFAGHSENLTGARHLFRLRGRSVHERL